MGYIYKIEIAGEIYIGSTKNKYLCNRQGQHNYNLRTPNNESYNLPLYKFCREHNVEKIICELIEEVDNENIFIKEQEYMYLLNPTLNSQRAFITEEQRLEQMKELKKKNNKIKANCPQCGMLIGKNNINRHINNIHKLQSQSS
tara:strand:+ start:41 stop:472 length:432 start_codon:yes stop_codon:yes gene_type:complete